MKREELVAFLEARCASMISTIRDKNADYTGGHPDPFFNFNAVELLDICSAEVGMMARMTDKFMRARSFVKLGILSVKSESVTDTLVDLAAYALLLAGVVEAKRRKTETKAPLTDSRRYSFEQPVHTFKEPGAPRQIESIVIYGTLQRRAAGEWVMMFDAPNLDAVRGASPEDIFRKLPPNLGTPKRLEDPKCQS